MVHIWTRLRKAFTFLNDAIKKRVEPIATELGSSLIYELDVNNQEHLDSLADKIAADFRIGEVSSSNSIFEYDKLNWMNGQYIKKMDLAKNKNGGLL